MLEATKIASAKAEIRRQMRDRRKKLSAVEQDEAKHAILELVRPLLLSAKNIAIYHAIAKELSLECVIDYCLNEGINVFAPVATLGSRVMRFEQVFSLSPRPIFYPENYISDRSLAATKLDLVLLPLVACDYQGYRLGQGGGYYDSTFAVASKTARLCGVGYDWQLLEYVPHDKWDLRLDFFVSESRLVHFGKDK